MRTNWAGFRQRDDEGNVVAKDWMFESLCNKPLNEWFQVSNTVVMTYEAVNGNEPWVAQPIFIVDLGDDTTQHNLEGLMIWGDVFWGLTPDPDLNASTVLLARDPTSTRVVSVDFSDFVILSTDFGKSSPHAAGGVANIPAPAGLVLLTLGGLLLVRRRRS